MMLDIGCKQKDLLTSMYRSGVDIYGLKEETEILFAEEEFPSSRLSLFDLSRAYWKSPAKFDFIWTGSALDYAGRAADNFSTTIVNNLAKGGVLVVTPPPEFESVGDSWGELWIDRLTKTGLKFLPEETDRIRRVTHRVGREGSEFVFMRPE
jgi:hypothetical protein